MSILILPAKKSNNSEILIANEKIVTLSYSQMFCACSLFSFRKHLDILTYESWKEENTREKTYGFVQGERNCLW